MGQGVMEISQLRIALFSGNYNYVRDGANQALNKLVRHLLDAGVQLRGFESARVSLEEIFLKVYGEQEAAA